jgi:hypothetical protein
MILRQDIILMCRDKLPLELDFHNDFGIVLLSCHKTKKARLNINFTHLYDSVKARKTRLGNLVTTSWKHVKLVFCYTRACAFYLRQQLL